MLFDADAIIEAQNQKDQKEFILDKLDLPEGMEPPVLVINVSKDIRTRANSAKKRYNTIQGGYQEGEVTWKPVDEPERYLESVLGFCFERVDGMYQPNTPKPKQRKAFLLQATKTEKTAKYISGLLMEFFDGESSEDTEEKN